VSVFAGGIPTIRARPLHSPASAVVEGVALDRCRPMPWPAAAAVLAPVAEALAELHARGWVHGDVAPANVVVRHDGTGALIDLGCAAPVGAARPTGTPGWVAPEVAAGAPVTPAADVWSLAAVAVGAVTGAPPTTGAPVGAEGDLALRRALADEVAARPTADELAAGMRLAARPMPPLLAGCPDLRAATTTDFGPRPPAPPVVPRAPARRAGPLLAASAVVVVAATWSWRAGAEEPAAPRRPPCPALPAGAPLAGDPDGDGCEVAARWHDGVLHIALEPGADPARVAVGAAGDVVVLGDWDCDGRDTPAAYRPSSGVVTLWDAWPSAGATVAPTRTVQAPSDGDLVVERGRCDQPTVTAGR
jgi:hypothetical protein